MGASGTLYFWKSTPTRALGQRLSSRMPTDNHPWAWGRPMSQPIIDLFKEHVIANYTRYPVVLERGEGSYVWDTDGNRFLDFFPGWGCDLLGHCPEPVVRAVQQQVAT